LRLLIDTANVGSPGGFQLQFELARCAEQQCPDGSDVVLVQASDAEEVRSGERLRVISAERAKGWGGLWRWFNRTLPEIAREHQADVVYSLGGYLSDALCRVSGTVNSVNNMLPFTPHHIRYFPLYSKDRLRLLLLQKLYVRSSKKADALVLPSRHGLDTLCRFAGDLSGKAYVAMNPVPDYVRYSLDSPPTHPYGGKRYLFYLSVVFWYKNHLNLIEAYKRAIGKGHRLPDLILAGPPAEPAYVKRIEQAIADDSLQGRVKYLGKVPRDDIPGWLHHATINVFPSTCETNSFVQSEILGAHGVMACSNCAPMPEVAGDAAELFDPEDPDSIADVVVRLSEDEERRAELRRLAARRAQEFTRESCGDAIWLAVKHANESFAARQSKSGRKFRSTA
jgi:glycosyltransferase involved in cell wall biosynthesis